MPDAYGSEPDYERDGVVYTITCPDCGRLMPLTPDECDDMEPVPDTEPLRCYDCFIKACRHAVGE